MNILLIGNLAEDRQESMQRFTALLRDGLQARGHTVTVLAPTLRLARLGPKYRYGGLPKYLGYFDKFVLFPRRLRRFIRHHRPDVVHITDHANAVYASAIEGVPVVATCHDLLQIRASLGEVPQQSVGYAGRKYQAWIRRALGGLPLVACVSHQTRADLLRLTSLPPHHAVVIPNALNYAYAPMPAAVAQSQLVNLSARHRLDPTVLDSTGRGFLLHVGGDQWYKNREGLLAIYSRLQSLLSPAPRLVLVGPPLGGTSSSQSSLEGESAGIIFLHGVTNPELAALYNLAKALVFPSWEEGFGWPIAEAQACGCPVFATNRAPMTEVGGDSSVYFDPQNPSDAAAVIAAAWPGRAARRALGLAESQRWQPAPMLEAYEALYRQPR